MLDGGSGLHGLSGLDGGLFGGGGGSLGGGEGAHLAAVSHPELDVADNGWRDEWLSAMRSLAAKLCVAPPSFVGHSPDNSAPLHVGQPMRRKRRLHGVSLSVIGDQEPERIACSGQPCIAAGADAPSHLTQVTRAPRAPKPSGGRGGRGGWRARGSASATPAPASAETIMDMELIPLPGPAPTGTGGGLARQ